MKSDYKERAIRFLMEVYPYIANCTDEVYSYQRAVKRYNRLHSRNVQVCHGCARIALVTFDYVVKFDYDQWEVKRIGGCADEVKFYTFAKKEGFSYLFAEITPFEYQGRMFYIMPRVYGIGRYEDEYVQQYLNDDDRAFVERYLYDMHEFNYGFMRGYPVIVDYALNVFFEHRRDDSAYNTPRSNTLSTYNGEVS